MIKNIYSSDEARQKVMIVAKSICYQKETPINPVNINNLNLIELTKNSLFSFGSTWSIMIVKCNIEKPFDQTPRS